MFKNICLIAVLSIVYTKLSLGDWTLPEPVAVSPTNDFGVTLTLDNSNHIWTAWYTFYDGEYFGSIAPVVTYFNGESWVTPVQMSPAFGINEYWFERVKPGIAKDYLNNIWLSWAPYREAVKQEFGVWTSYYNGSNWSTPLGINDYGEGRVPLEFNKATNKLVLAFEIGGYQNMTNFTSLYLTSFDGDTWSIPCCIAQGWSDYVSGNWETFGKASLASTGSLIWVGFEDWGRFYYPDSSFFHAVYVGCSNLQSGSFVPEWSHDGEECDITSDPYGNIWVSFVDSGAVYTAYRDTAGFWSIIPSVIQGANFSSITVDITGRVWLTVNSSNDIWVTYWTGVGWAELQPITSDTVEDSHPEIIGDASGRMWVLWERGGDIYYSTSFEGIEESNLISTYSAPFLALYPNPASSEVCISYLIPSLEG
ncbi:MAG: hypothetical protein QMD71_06640 [bacterium]|nr:hypothetical protein [bacterium]